MEMEHEALCAHWALVLLVGLNLLPERDGRDARRALGVALALCVFAAGVHPVIAAMVLPLALALCVRTVLEGQLGWRGPALAATVSVACVLGLFYAFGYLGTGVPVGGNDFGGCPADLATFINPSGYRDSRWSRFLPRFPGMEDSTRASPTWGWGASSPSAPGSSSREGARGTWMISRATSRSSSAVNRSSASRMKIHRLRQATLSSAQFFCAE